MNRAVLLVTFLLASITFFSFGQSPTASKEYTLMQQAEELSSSSFYNQAIGIYLEILEDNEDNTTAKLKLAALYYKIHNYKESQNWYESVLKKPFDNEIPISSDNFFNYAELLLTEERIEDALYWYELYGNSHPEDSRVAQRIEGIKKIPELKEMSSKYKVNAVSFNSKYNDFGATFYKNGLVFVSDRDEATDDKVLKYFDLYFCVADEGGDFKKPVKFSENINTNLNEGPACFYARDEKVIFTRNIVTNMVKTTEEERMVLNLQLFYSEKDSSNNDWKIPTPLTINNKNYSIGHPSISGDGKYLYFSSSAPEGSGGTDIYVSEWANNNWSGPKNLGVFINTEGNEMFPYLYQDTLLYFASDGHAGLGGLDIYSFNLNNNKLQNLGGGINSSKDDFGLIRKDDMGYFSSNRKENKTGKNDDIYKVEFLPEEVPLQDSIVIIEQDSFLVEIVYTVQILALKNSKLVSKKFLKDLRGVLKHDGKDGFHRYTYGSYKTLDEASRILDEVKSKGYDDAFIRREALYTELSKGQGINVDRLYKH